MAYKYEMPAGTSDTDMAAGVLAMILSRPSDKALAIEAALLADDGYTDGLGFTSWLIFDENGPHLLVWGGETRDPYKMDMTKLRLSTH